MYILYVLKIIKEIPNMKKSKRLNQYGILNSEAPSNYKTRSFIKYNFHAFKFRGSKGN